MSLVNPQIYVLMLFTNICVVEYSTTDELPPIHAVPSPQQPSDGTCNEEPTDQGDDDHQRRHDRLDKPHRRVDRHRYCERGEADPIETVQHLGLLIR